MAPPTPVNDNCPGYGRPIPIEREGEEIAELRVLVTELRRVANVHPRSSAGQAIGRLALAAYWLGRGIDYSELMTGP